MSYHIEVPRSGFEELPDRILVREDGYLGAYKFYGEPIVDYWYVPEQDAPQAALEKRIDELCQEVERLKGENAKLVDENKELRELCEDMADYSRSAGFDNMCDWFRDRMDALGLVG